MTTRPQFRGRPEGFGRTASGVAAALFLAAAAAAAQEKEPPRITRPDRVLTIQGQVSLPEGMPVGQAVVTLTSSSGVPRQTYTTDQGRFEFQGVPAGGYSLTAKSLTEPQLTADPVDADTTRTATGDLYVKLTLRREAEAAHAVPKAGVISAAEAAQKVPKQARKAFRDGVKFRKENRPEEALRSFGLAVELYPEYFQALAERGDLFVSQRKLAEAAGDFERALRLDPRYGPALRGAGYCKLEGREFEAAAEYLERASAAQPDEANNYLLLGIAYLELDRREQARVALMKALSFNTARGLRAHIHLGNLFAREGRYREAAEELRKYLEAKPADPEAARLRAVESRWRALAGTP